MNPEYKNIVSKLTESRLFKRLFVLSVLICFILIYMMYPSLVISAPPNPLIYDFGKIPKGMEKQALKPRLPVPKLPIYPIPKKAQSTGTIKAVVILIQFYDMTRAGSHTQSYFSNLIFDSADTGSMYNYYKEASYNQLFVDDGDSVASAVNANNPPSWVTSNHSIIYYGADGNGEIDTGQADSPVNIYELAREAVQKADSFIDFSQFDTDGNGVVDNVIIVHSGRGQEASGVTTDIWSHQWAIGGDDNPLTGELVDGVRVKTYSMQSEYSPMGIFAHEFGHMIGLPDLYNTSTGTSVVGDWCLMDHGSWLNGGDTPSHPSSWGKALLGWTTPSQLTSTTENIEVYPQETTINAANKSIYKIPINVAATTEEYFMAAYRKKTGFGTSLPGEGLLIWHIDDSVLDEIVTVRGITDTRFNLNAINANSSHRAVDVEEADGTDATGEPTDPFGESSTYISFATPQSNAYNGKESYISILNINGDGNDYMTMNLYMINLSLPLFMVNAYSYPNPTRTSQATILFTLTNVSSDKSIEIYSLTGELVREVPNGEIQQKSITSNRITYNYDWDCTNDSGGKVASGVYLYVVKVGSFIKKGKIAVIK